MQNPQPVVYIVDDDPGVRKSLSSLLRSAGFEVQTFGGGAEFLKASRGGGAPECLILDIQMPGMSGVDLQQVVAQLPLPIPIIFITAHGDIPLAVRMIKAGALEFLTKPFNEEDLLNSTYKAIRCSSADRAQLAELIVLRSRFASLTPREAEVMQMVVAGMLNKQIAADLGTSEKTIKAHRGQVMRKMKARSLPDLVRLSQRLSRPPHRVTDAAPDRERARIRGAGSA